MFFNVAPFRSRFSGPKDLNNTKPQLLHYCRAYQQLYSHISDLHQSSRCVDTVKWVCLVRAGLVKDRLCEDLQFITQVTNDKCFVAVFEQHSFALMCLVLRVNGIMIRRRKCQLAEGNKIQKWLTSDQGSRARTASPYWWVLVGLVNVHPSHKPTCARTHTIS